jgi:hypothetical protein
MVFGFGKKEIEVTLDGYNYSPGETVTGKVAVNLKKPVEARQLKVSLIGIGKRTSLGMNVSSRQTSQIFDFKMPLDGEKTYTSGEYSFKIKIPANMLQSPPDGIVGKAIKTMQILSGSWTNISWYIQAALDRPGKPDVSSKKVQINIG